MYLKAVLDDRFSHGFLPGYLSHETFEGLEPALFCVDSACSITMIRSQTCSDIGIKTSELSQGEAICVYGDANFHPRCLEDVKLYLLSYATPSDVDPVIYGIDLDYVHVLPPIDSEISLDEEEIEKNPSNANLLGMDVLSKMNHWYYDYDNEMLYIEMEGHFTN